MDTNTNNYFSIGPDLGTDCPDISLLTLFYKAHATVFFIGTHATVWKFV